MWSPRKKKIVDIDMSRLTLTTRATLPRNCSNTRHTHPLVPKQEHVHVLYIRIIENLLLNMLFNKATKESQGGESTADLSIDTVVAFIQADCAGVGKH